jgi:ABC-type nickel/cobalt efflux system permease component RcnA
MEVGYLIIFWYGILHAFGPDHLTAIADFSIAKSMRKTMMVTVMFAFGHGVMLFAFVKVLEFYALPEAITGYGDMISSSVIIIMGLYLLFMVAAERIRLNRHLHGGKEHIHIYFGKEHSHSDRSASASAWTMGALMGIGGVRGMLVTLGMLNGSGVEWTMVLAFVGGVSLVFIAFGALILQLNRRVLTNIHNVRMTFAAAGLISVAVGSQMLLA